MIERHVVHGLETVFSPVTVSSWDTDQVAAVAAEPDEVARQRAHLETRRAVLETGRAVFRSVIRGTAAGAGGGGSGSGSGSREVGRSLM